MTMTNKKVVLGTADMLGSVGGGSKDVGSEDEGSVDSVHGLGDGSCCKSVSFEGCSPDAYTITTTTNIKPTNDNG